MDSMFDEGVYKTNVCKSDERKKMKNLNSNEVNAVYKLKDALSKDYKLIQMKLFGSKAKGNYSDESDIDLLIVLENYDWKAENEIYEICFEIGLEYDVLLSPVIFSKKEFDDKLTKITPFYKVVVKEGLQL